MTPEDHRRLRGPSPVSRRAFLSGASALAVESLLGHEHTVLRRPQFYTASVDGVSLRDWVARLLAGQEVADVGEAWLTC